MIGFSIELSDYKKCDLHYCCIILDVNFSLGTPIPEGLHVRHNFQTGVTEAKLMDSDDVKEKDSETSNSSRANSVTLHPEKAIPDEQKPQVAIDKSKLDEYSVDELQSRLQKIIEDGTEKDINVTSVFLG